MAATRKGTIHPRRRRDDAEEEEGSAAGDIEDDSLSEGSAASLDEHEREGSDASAGEDVVPPIATANAKAKSPTKAEGSLPQEAPSVTLPAEQTTVIDTVPDVLDIGGGEAEETHTENAQGEALVSIPKGPKHETPAQRARREHQEYIQERNSNPAFIPNRGGFFLHDDRASNTMTFTGRPYGRGRGRGAYEPHLPRGNAFPEPTEKQWAHDLHDRHETSEATNKPVVTQPSAAQVPPPTKSASAPNRSFSFSTVLGNVAVQLSLPGMSERKLVSNVVRKHHTLLPQHRPPLRRDKPVRISIPDELPRYIFPSTERSFIFIPRAMRPNQQPYMRGRGRGSFHGSRRTSIFGGSSYTPSVAMSRKSSIGGPMRDHLRSPSGSNMSRPTVPGFDYTRPVVRLPNAGGMPGSLPMSAAVSGTQTPLYPVQMNGSASYGFHSNAIPMHQPRPQKTLSLADIESPAALSVRAPQQQREQPFHHQVPTFAQGEQGMQQALHNGAMGIDSAPQGTPLSHIPEGAVYANPFQPFPQMQQMMYPAYTATPGFYNGMQYGPLMQMPMAAGYAPAPGQMNQQMSMAMPPDPNGMVYYFNQSQYTANGMGQDQYPAQGSMHVQPMMNPQAPYYYPPAPNGNFYPPQSST